MKRAFTILLGLIMIAGSSFAQGLQLTEMKIIDTSNEYLSLGTRAIIKASDGNYHAFYIKRGTTDTICHVMTADGGITWTGYDIVALNTQGGSGNSYHISTLAAEEDDLGKFHVVYTYRGTPLYNASSSYPPTHIGYTSNETGSWIHYENVINDSAVLAAQMGNVPTNYIYDNYIYSQGGEEYFSGYDYAWFATKYNVLYAKRGSLGNWGTTSALVTYDRGQIDKYSLGPARLFGDENNTLFTLWLNRHSGHVKVIENSGSGWSAAQVIDSVKDPADGVISNNHISVIPGSTAYANMSRWVTGSGATGLYNFKREGGVWSMASVDIPGTFYYPNAILKNDTVFTLLLKSTYDQMVLIGQHPNGFTAPMVVSLPDTLAYTFLNAPEGEASPILYVKFDAGLGKYYLGAGKIDRLLTSNSESISSAEVGIKVYPNPSSGSFSVKLKQNLPGTFRIDLVDLSGRSVLSLEKNLDKNAGFRIESTGLNPGVYFLKLEDPDGRSLPVQRVVLF